MFDTFTTPQTTQGLRRTGPRRLRESCEPCSAAKVRCSKDKPVCTRCTERDLPCVYLSTRRSGRPPNKAANNSKTVSRNNDSAHIPTNPTSTSPETLPGQSCFHTVSSIDPVNLPESVHTAHTSPGPETDSSLSMSPEMLSEWSSRDLDDFFATLVSVPSLDELSPFSDLLQTDGMSSSEVASSTSDIFSQPIISSHHSVSDCNCLTTALGLLAKSESLADQGFGPGNPPFCPTESLILENERVVVSVDSILQCRHTHDSQVLIILALVVSKVLDRYLRAARVAPATTEQGLRSSSAFTQKQYHQSGMAKAYLHGEDSLRTAGQLVLGELHRVLKVVNGLATRLNERGSRSSTPNSKTAGWMGPSSSGSTRGFDEPSIVSFSSTMLDQLGTDLRGQLKSVIATITGMLQGASWE